MPTHAPKRAKSPARRAKSPKRAKSPARRAKSPKRTAHAKKHTAKKH